MSDTRELVNRTLNALVDEAYQHALNKGIGITNPDGWRAWKRKIYADTARREGKGYLRQHAQRLGILAAARRVQLKCSACESTIIGSPYTHDDRPDDYYCSNECAGHTTMSLTRWLDEVATPEQRANMTRILNSRQEGVA